MKTVTFINHAYFANWHKSHTFYIKEETFETMQAWCEETFGFDNWARMLFQSRHVYPMNMIGPGRYKQHQIELYFKNEGDLGFFILKYGLKSQYV